MESAFCERSAISISAPVLILGTVLLDDCIGINPLQDIHHCVQMELVMRPFVLGAFHIGVRIIGIVRDLDMASGQQP